MLELGDHPRLAREAREEGGILTEGRMQDLDRDVAVERGVIGLVDRGHAALAELLEDAVRADILTVGERHCTSLGYPAGPSPVRGRERPCPD